MTLFISIGNTNLTCGIQTANTNTIASFKLRNSEFTAENLAEQINQLLVRNKIKKLTACTLASVVPEMIDTISSAVQQFFSITPIIVSSSSDLGLNLSLYNCECIGVDRLLCCTAAYASCSSASIVFDLGTATTANVVNGKGFFLGGLIIPGMELQSQMLAKAAAMLPDINISEDAALIGNNTAQCINSGILYSTAFFINQYILEINSVLEQEATVYITGGNSDYIKPYINSNIISRPNLLLEGLAIYSSKL